MKLTSSAHYSLFFLSSVLGLSSASDSSHLKDDAPCIARSPTSGLYFDLNAISLSPPDLNDGNKAMKDARNQSWFARGHDYPANFTINICAPVIENVTDVIGVEASRWKNVSAYYEHNDKIYSIGYGKIFFSTSLTSNICAWFILLTFLDHIQTTSLRTFLPRPQTHPQLHQWLALRGRSQPGQFQCLYA
jgi:hypothetical protein